MKTILLFSRANLAHLYGQLSHYITRAQVLHVAYSKEESAILNKYGIKTDYIYLDLFKQEYDSCKLSDHLIALIDNDIIKYSEGRFNLNSAIQSDRGFSLLSYEESLKSAIAHYEVWGKIFLNNHVDLFEHEPCSLFFNYIASILCKKQGGVYSYQISLSNDIYDFAYLNANFGEYDFWELKYYFDKYVNNPDLIDLHRCKNYINSFRKETDVFMGGLMNKRESFIKLLYISIREKLRIRYKHNCYHRIYNNIEYWTSTFRYYGIKINNIKNYRRNKVKFESKLPDGERFFFYPFHLEPEAVVQYLADGIYTNQVKLIENIAASLPPNIFLYVKDHPHEYAYRNADDYKRLMMIPNIRLINQNIPGKAIIEKSLGVITINGSAGFEALVMGKQVYCFGTCMYSFMPRVKYISNIREFRSILYSNVNNVYKDDDTFYAYVMAVLKSTHPGYINGYVGGPQIKGLDYNQNAKILGLGIEEYLLNLDKISQFSRANL